MKRYNNNGFTLVEVMIAVAIIGIVLTALASLEIALMRGTVKTSTRFDRLWHMLFFLNESRLKKVEKDRLSKTVKDPEMTMTFERISMPKESSLADMTDLFIERVQSSYKIKQGTIKNTIMTFKYKPKDEDETGHESS